MKEDQIHNYLNEGDIHLMLVMDDNDTIIPDHVRRDL